MDPQSETAHEAPGRPTPGYIAILAGAAVLILIVGALLRPKGLAEEPSVSLTETASLQALSQRVELRDMADFLSSRVTAIGSHLVYLPGRGVSSVAWASPDSMVTSGSGQGDSPVIAELRPQDSMATPVVRTPAAPAARRGWVIVAARRPDGRLVSSVGMSGGETSLPCGQRDYKALVLSMPLGDSFQGGGIFDLEGNLIGVVGRCGTRVVALSAVDIARALTASASLETGLLRAYGLRVSTLDSAASRYFAADSGVLVTEVVLASAADEGELNPGDVVVALDSLSVRSPEDLANLLPRRPGTGRTLTLLREGRRHEVSLSVPSTSPGTRGLELATVADGLPLSGVEPGSAAERMGLRAGDRILRIGRMQPRTPQEARQALVRAAEQPLYVVYVRENSERGVLLH